MKKIFLFLGAAALMVVACNKSQSADVPEAKIGGDELSFRSLASGMTKGAELEGNILKDGYGIYTAATQKSANGVIENASFFAGGEQLFKNVDTPVAAATLWKAYGASAFQPVYWPIGGDALLDFLAYAEPIANHSSTAGEWKVVFDYPTTNIARQFTITNVDTYAHQNDFMYAAVQNQSKALNSGANSVKLDFAHAQALLMFNVKVDAEAAAAGFKVNKIMFIDDSRMEQLRLKAQADQNFDALHDAWDDAKTAAYADIDADDVTYPDAEAKTGAKAAWDTANPEPTAAVLADITALQVPLKTVGTFCVNNDRVELDAAWSGLVSHEANYLMPDGAEGFKKSAANDAGVAEDGIRYGSAIAASESFAQLGETLLIPEQEKVNFVMEYVMNGKTMYYKFNDFRGVWKMGMKYIYDLNVDVAEIVITEGVAPYVDATAEGFAL